MTQEPQHYWPFDRFEPKPAKPVGETETQADKTTIIPYQVNNNSDIDGLAFAPVFFEVDGDGAPKASSLSPEQMQKIAEQTLED